MRIQAHTEARFYVTAYIAEICPDTLEPKPKYRGSRVHLYKNTARN